jgi:hypothetical protein
MNWTSPVHRLGELTQDQWGLVTRHQLEDAGFASTTIERLTSPGGVLERVSWGVYQLARAPGYAAEARRSLLLKGRTLNEALALIKPFIDPLLNGTAAGDWDPQSQQWASA